jgi:hypothetical protein
MLRSAILCLALALPHAAWAQGLGAVLRAGAGIDSQGKRVLGGQIELVDFGTSSSVEIALALFEGRLVEDYQVAVPGAIRPTFHDYHEDTRVRGAGPIASVLIGQGPRDSRGPYLAVGLGLGMLDVGWHVESPTDRDLGSLLPTGGSVSREDVLLLGGLGSLGLGFRVHRRLDVRAQALTLMTPSTDAREDAKFLTTLMLTAGVGI